MSYSPDARKMAVEAYYNSGQSLEDAAKMCGVAKNTLYNWVKRERAKESFEDRPRSGKPRKLNEKHMARLIELTQQYPDWTQQQFADQMNQDFEGLGLKQPCLCITLKRAKISLKKNNGALKKRTPSVLKSSRHNS